MQNFTCPVLSAQKAYGSQPCVKQVYQHHFSYSICSLHVCVSCFGPSCNILNIIMLINVIRDNYLLKAQMVVSTFFLEIFVVVLFKFS